MVYKKSIKIIKVRKLSIEFLIPCFEDTKEVICIDFFVKYHIESNVNNHKQKFPSSVYLITRIVIKKICD